MCQIKLQEVCFPNLRNKEGLIGINLKNKIKQILIEKKSLTN